ncbi:MAG: RNA polymerase factor sigma-54 [Syntrophobacterales bacterium]|nr:MAG: RNA polymerase factor sigma-54 [Syntrophobacterales bacterium]
MPFELKQNLKLTQQLIMTPQLQQSIKLLQLSRLELIAAINTELEENPLLEEKYSDDDMENEITPEIGEIKVELTTKEITGEGDGRDDFDWDGYLEDYGPVGGTYSHEDTEAPSLENVLTKTGTLTDHLLWQLNLSHFTEDEKRVGEQIIGNLDNNGYLMASLDEIAAIEKRERDFVEKVLEKVQEFDPPGVAARDLKECLLIQIRLLVMSSDLVEKIIEIHLNDLVTKNYYNIAKKQKVSIEEVQEAVLLISMLDPKPGSLYNEERPQYVIPDIFVFKVGDEYRIVLNDDGLPKLKLSSLYRKILGTKSENSDGDNNKTYIKERMQSAIWLIKSIQQRQRTIYRVSESIVRQQKDFFDLGINYLKPMVLRDVAYDVDMHESTISRVTTNKYMHTPRGIFELKYFFNSGISRTHGDPIASESVKEKIKKLISEEDKKKPYKDSEIVDILKGSGISIARRTVAKYREMTGIIPSSKRKKYF